jgi:thermitase
MLLLRGSKYDLRQKNRTDLKKLSPIKLLNRENKLSVTRVFIFLVAVLALGAVGTWHSSAAPAGDKSETRLILRFKANATKAQRDGIIRNENLNIVKEIPEIGVKVITVPSQTASAVENALSHNPRIDYIERDQTLKPQEQLPNDPYFLNSGSWNLAGGAWGWYATHTTQAWDISEGDPAVNIAILDTGIKTAGLSDLDGQISSTYNVLDGTTDATTNAGNHGTFVAGVAGLAIDNGVGNAGYCPKCKLMIVQVGSDSFAYWSDVAAGLVYAADKGAKVANMSWAGTTDSTTLSDATTYAHDQGMVLFAAAGNSNCDCVSYPAADPYVLGVSGTADATGNKAGDSNYGSWVKIAAPEGDVSAWPTINGQPGYGAFGGTSSASPAAAGIAGLLFSYNSSLTNAQVEQALESTAAPVNFNVAYGRVDSLASLQSLGASDPQTVSVPVQVTQPQIYYEVNGLTSIAPLTNIPQVGQILVRGIGGWTGSAGLNVTGLQWQRCNTSGSNCTTVSTSRTYTIKAADNGYTIKLGFSMNNSQGSVAASAITGMVGGPTDTNPPTASISSPVNGANVSGTISVLANASDNVGVAHVDFYVDGTQFASVSSTPYNVSLNTLTLTNGTHTLQAKAYDAAGNVGTSSSVSVNVNNVTPPATPTGLAPTPLNAAATITWNANTESNLAGYQLQYKTTAGSSWTLVSGIATTSYTVSGLANGTSYDFQVRAKNTSAMVSAWTASVSATPQAPPDTTAPTVSITSPPTGATVSGTIPVNASASDNVGVTHVDFYIDGSQFASTSTSPYTASLNTTTLTNGTHTLLTKAYDAAGNVGTSTSVSVTVNNAPPPDTISPTATITSPANGTVITNLSKVNITASATDNVGVVTFELYIDGQLKTSVSGSSLAYTWTLNKNVKSGAHVILVKAHDAAGNIGQAQISVTK